MANNAVQLVQMFGISKSQIEEVSEVIATSIKEGEEDPLLMLANLKAMETLITSVKKKITDVVDDSINEYPEKSFIKHGVRFTKGNRKSYDYSVNQAWVEVNAKKKGIEAFMKVLTTPVADPDSGEIINPPPFKSSEFVTITLAK